MILCVSAVGIAETQHSATAGYRSVPDLPGPSTNRRPAQKPPVPNETYKRMASTILTCGTGTGAVGKTCRAAPLEIIDT